MNILRVLTLLQLLAVPTFAVSVNFNITLYFFYCFKLIPTPVQLSQTTMPGKPKINLKLLLNHLEYLHSLLKERKHLKSFDT